VRLKFISCTEGMACLPSARDGGDTIGAAPWRAGNGRARCFRDGVGTRIAFSCRIHAGNSASELLKPSVLLPVESIGSERPGVYVECTMSEQRRGFTSWESHERDVVSCGSFGTQA
jgi:hypothetical protein